MKLATIQASAIKSTFEVLKDILNDVNVYFKPDGMYITTLDTARTSLVDMYLSSDNFEEYECEDEIVAGINENQIEVPEMNMTTITPMASVDFQRICRDMYNIGSDIEITRDGNLFRLKCEGDFASQETEIQCTTESPHISGIYSLRYMNIFTKATSMCSTVQIMQEDQNRFLILKYNVANLGDLKFYLATKTRTDQ